MAKNGFMNAVNAQVDKILYRYGKVARQQTIDKVCIALGEMGFTPEQFREFNDKFFDVEKEFCFEILDDAKADKKLEYSKEKIDRVLKQYIPEDLFAPYEERYEE